MAASKFSCRCKFCSENFDFSENLGEFTSSVNNKRYFVEIPNRHNLPPCKLDHVIYLITCSNCFKQYVGLTTSELGKRAADYRSKCKTKNKKQLVHKHFICDCPNSNFNDNAKFRIINRIHESELTTARVMVAEQLRESESFWINELETLYPKGLNVQPGRKMKKKKKMTMVAAAAAAATTAAEEEEEEEEEAGVIPIPLWSLQERFSSLFVGYKEMDEKKKYYNYEKERGEEESLFLYEEKGREEEWRRRRRNDEKLLHFEEEEEKEEEFLFLYSLETNKTLDIEEEKKRRRRRRKEKEENIVAVTQPLLPSPPPLFPREEEEERGRGARPKTKKKTEKKKKIMQKELIEDSESLYEIFNRYLHLS